MENTTNINELPTESTPPENRNLPEGEINSSIHRMIDPHATLREEKQVRFQEVSSSTLKKGFELKDNHKIIIFTQLE